tara:strand:+ start:228 stop:545 length:318 start_codon:yes stop_codon:yes gene_type:complete
MANTFKNQITEVSNSDIDVVTSGGQVVVVGLQIGNTTSSEIKATVKIHESGQSAVTLVNQVPIPANSMLSVLEGDKVVLENGDKLQVASDTASSATAVVSYLEIT